MYDEGGFCRGLKLAALLAYHAESCLVHLFRIGGQNVCEF